MPYYSCTAPVGALSEASRRRIAQDVTQVHCEATDAPPTFVHVVFFEDPTPAREPYVVAGTIRAGRSDDVKRRLVDGIRQVVAAGAGVAETDVAVTTTDIPAKWVMEGGELLPEPGEEEAWLERHSSPARLAPPQ